MKKAHHKKDVFFFSDQGRRNLLPPFRETIVDVVRRRDILINWRCFVAVIRGLLLLSLCCPVQRPTPFLLALSFLFCSFSPLSLSSHTARTHPSLTQETHPSVSVGRTEYRHTPLGAPTSSTHTTEWCSVLRQFSDHPYAASSRLPLFGTPLDRVLYFTPPSARFSSGNLSPCPHSPPSAQLICFL